MGVSRLAALLAPPERQAMGLQLVGAGFGMLALLVLARGFGATMAGHYAAVSQTVLLTGIAAIFGYDQDRFATVLHYERPIAASLAAFKAARETTADILSKTSGKDNPQMLVAAYRQPATDLSAIDRSSAPLWFVCQALRDNPLGQGAEQTPLGILRPDV